MDPSPSEILSASILCCRHVVWYILAALFLSTQIIHTDSNTVLGQNDTGFSCDGSANTFRVMFKEPVEILPNVNYTACATLKVSHVLGIIPDTRAAQHCLGVHFSHRKVVHLIAGIVQNLDGLINPKFQLFSMLGIHLNNNIILEKCCFLYLYTSDSCGQTHLCFRVFRTSSRQLPSCECDVWSSDMNALWEFLYIWHKCPLGLKNKLLRCWCHGHCDLTKHIFLSKIFHKCVIG